MLLEARNSESSAIIALSSVRTRKQRICQVARRTESRGRVGQERGVVSDREGLLSVTLKEVGGAENCKKNFLDSTVLTHAKELGRKGSWRV